MHKYVSLDFFFLISVWIVSIFVQASTAFLTDVFWILPIKMYQNTKWINLLYKQNNMQRLSLDLRPRIKILPMAAVNTLTWNWCLIPSLMGGDTLRSSKARKKTTFLCNLFCGCFVWFNNLWPEISFPCEVTLIVTILIWKSYSLSGTWRYNSTAGHTIGLAGCLPFPTTVCKQ